MSSSWISCALAAAILVAGAATGQETTAPAHDADAQAEAALAEAERLRDPDVATQSVLRCLHANPGAHRLCDGVHVTACVAAPTNSATSNRRACALAEAEAWERVLRDTMRHISHERAQSPDTAEATDSLQIYNAHDAWVAYRASHCRTMLIGFQPGASEPKAVEGECLRATAANRALEVLALADEYGYDLAR